MRKKFNKFRPILVKLIVSGVIAFGLAWIGGTDLSVKILSASLNLLSVAAGVFIGAVGIVMSYMSGMLTRMRTVLNDAGRSSETEGLIKGLDSVVMDIKYNTWVVLLVIAFLFFLDLFAVPVQSATVNFWVSGNVADLFFTFVVVWCVLFAFISVWDSVNAIFGFYEFSSEIEKIAARD